MKYEEIPIAIDSIKIKTGEYEEMRFCSINTNATISIDPHRPGSIVLIVDSKGLSMILLDSMSPSISINMEGRVTDMPVPSMP